MRVIIAGSRFLTDERLVKQAVEMAGFDITQVVSGGGRGIDTVGEEWARARRIPVKRFMADWEELGKAAGPIRNQQMADYADALMLTFVEPKAPATPFKWYVGGQLLSSETAA